MTNKLLFIGYVSLMLKAVSCGKSGKGKENDSKAKEIVNTQHMTYERERHFLFHTLIHTIAREQGQHSQSHAKETIQ